MLSCMDEHPVCLCLRLLKLFNSMHALTTIIVTYMEIQLALLNLVLVIILLIYG